MILLFSDWVLSKSQGGLLGYQYDNLTRELVVQGDLPEGWAWDILVSASGKSDTWPLALGDGQASITLTDDNLSVRGEYYLQLRGTNGDQVRHTNVITAYNSRSLSGAGQWPTLPTEWIQAEKDIKELNAHPPVPGSNGYWLLWDLSSHSYQESDLPVPVGPAGPPNVLEIGTVVTLPADQPATASITGESPAQKLNLGIPQGKQGATGNPGAPGKDGQNGVTPTLSAGNVETLEPGQPATASVTGEGPAYQINLGIPRGQTGAQGAPGQDGQNGVTPTLSAGNVETLEPGQPATASVTGNGLEYQINLGIPRGQTGAQGAPGQDGQDGQDGQTPTIAVGTVTTLDPGQDATAEITGETPNLVLSLGIPQGQPGKDGTEWTEQELVEKNISDYYAMRRTGKVYQTRFWKFAANPTSAGEKLLDNAGLVFEPSTDTEEGQDDYLNGQNPMFEWVNVNYIRDDDGAPRPTAIEGQEDYKTSGAVDVGAMQMSFWYKIDSSDEEYIYYTVSDTPHPELGLAPWPECVKADGTVLPWCIASKYFSGTASDGLQRSQPGLKPTRNNSYNSMITTYQNKGPGYWGAGAVRNTFQILFNAIKGATKSSQTLFAGTTNWSFQYSASVQRSEKDTYFPVTNSQANNLVVGAYVSVGYGSDNNGTVNQDREVATMHAYADDVKILRIEDLDENNKAVYLDVEESFDTMPVQLTDELSANITMSSMHWWSGATDSVLGHHDGSPTSNANGRFPYRVQGREYSVGGYAVASDTVAWLNEDGTRTMYSAPRGAEHVSANDSIKETYKESGTIPVHSGGAAADYWVGDCVVDPETGAWHPDAQGSGSTQGCGDMYYAGGTSANTFREFLQGGYLGGGSGAGSCCLPLWAGLGRGGWLFLAGD